MDSMTGRQKDPCLLVRVLALRGLGNIAVGAPEKVRANGMALVGSSGDGGGGVACGGQCLLWEWGCQPRPRPGDGVVARSLCPTAVIGGHGGDWGGISPPKSGQAMEWAAWGGGGGHRPRGWSGSVEMWYLGMWSVGMGWSWVGDLRGLLQPQCLHDGLILGAQPSSSCSPTPHVGVEQGNPCGTLGSYSPHGSQVLSMPSLVLWDLHWGHSCPIVLELWARVAQGSLQGPQRSCGEVGVNLCQGRFGVRHWRKSLPRAVQGGGGVSSEEGLN